VILYLDASALVKRYIDEPGSAEITALLANASHIGTANISRAEMTAALAKAMRMRVPTSLQASAARELFLDDWSAFIRIQITDFVVARACDYAWEHGLRGYDAVQLAAATVWAEALGDLVTFATFDRLLWQAARDVGLAVYPLDLL
jgi:predicted nucleic acid-binding protein